MAMVVVCSEPFGMEQEDCKKGDVCAYVCGGKLERERESEKEFFLWFQGWLSMKAVESGKSKSGHNESCFEIVKHVNNANGWNEKRMNTKE